VELKPAVVLFYVTGAMIFLQLLTGGLRIFGFLDESAHITAGFITFFLAIITLVAAALTKPRYRPAISISALLVVLILVQGLLGFDFLNTNDSAVIFVHFTNALIIYGLAISGVFMAMRWSKMTPARSPAQAKVS
jgi:heme A synthase